MDGGSCPNGPTDLSGIGAGDFRVSFTLQATQTGTFACVSQRMMCTAGTFWDIRVEDGKLFVEVDCSEMDTQIFGCAVVNDGQPHDIVVQRVNGTLYDYVDGRLDGSQAAPASFATLPPVEVATSVCVKPGSSTYALTLGTISNVCLFKMSEVQPDAGVCSG